MEDIFLRSTVTGLFVDKLSAPLAKFTNTLRNSLVEQTKFTQAMDGFKTKMNHLKGVLKPLGDELHNSMVEGLVKPKILAKQATEGIINKQKEMSQQSQSMKTHLEKIGIERLTTSMDSFRGVMGASVENWQKVNVAGENFRTKGGRIGNSIRMLTHGLKGFRMELLGIMFFGMMMANMFSGLLRPSMQMFGFFELWTELLKITFIPLMEHLLEPFIQFFDIITSLSHSTQLLIGVFVLLNFVFWKMMFIVGSLGLGLGSVIQYIPLLTKYLGGLSGLLTGTVAVAVAGFLLLLAGAVIAWRENFMGMKTWFGLALKGIGDMLGGVWDIIKHVFGAIFAFISGDTKKFWMHIKAIGKGLWKIVKGWFEYVVGVFMAWQSALTRIWWGAIKSVYGFLKGLVKGSSEAWGKVYDFIKKVCGWIWNKIKEKFPRIAGFIEDVMNKIKTKIQAIWAGIYTYIKLKLQMCLLRLKEMFTSEDIIEWGKSMISLLADGVSLGWSYLSTALTNLIDKAKTKLVDLWDDVKRKVFGDDDNDDRGRGSSGNIPLNNRLESGGRYRIDRKTGKWTKLNDFIWRPGSNPVSINQKDTLVGLKGKNTGMGGVNITATYNLYGFSNDDLKRELDTHDRRLVNDIRRLTRQ